MFLVFYDSKRGIEILQVFLDLKFAFSLRTLTCFRTLTSVFEQWNLKVAYIVMYSN